MKTGLILGSIAALANGINGLVPIHRGQKSVPGQYIVVFKEGVDPTPHFENLKAFLELDSPGNEILNQYSIGAFQGYALRATENALRFIRQADEVVDYIEEDQYVTAYDVQRNPPSWGLDRISQRNLPLDSQFAYPTSAGSGVNLYTIDTGILITHNDFGGRAKWGYNAVSGSTNNDLNGHGTHCSGTMAGTSYGVAKKGTIFAVKVLGDNGSGTNAGVIDGVNWVASQHRSSSNKKTVANMSLGGGASTAVDNAVNSAVSDGVYIAVAAGNDNANACNYSPARAANAVTVGATTSADAKASYSNYGSCVDINAPGSSITSTWIGSNSATNTISGTSMASPHVAGVMALYLGQNKAPTAANLASASTKNVLTGLVTGTPNNLLYVDASL